ncbi:hypothetical protein PFMC_04370 [Plasmodium falciparum CAMP/Malaysia]|uniref:Uncharacterized protein n=1 Tax=Plasmodium falciparum (isolate Camp / Malaysia) TaxID=5835 RepID=A0A024X4C5_PLAFC|nr:hypothetical protein PFMC_04370 [Plasmodium falciparum CAMP/Malaysia]
MSYKLLFIVFCSKKSIICKTVVLWYIYLNYHEHVIRSS